MRTSPVVSRWVKNTCFEFRPQLGVKKAVSECAGAMLHESLIYAWLSLFFSFLLFITFSLYVHSSLGTDCILGQHGAEKITITTN